MHWLTDRADFRQLKAVRTRRLFLADGNQFFNRPGPRVVETFRIIDKILTGDKCCDREN
jgi:iron complex transport system substrate-binding protein